MTDVADTKTISQLEAAKISAAVQAYVLGDKAPAGLSSYGSDGYKNEAYPAVMKGYEEGLKILLSSGIENYLAAPRIDAVPYIFRQEVEYRNTPALTPLCEAVQKRLESEAGLFIVRREKTAVMSSTPQNFPRSGIYGEKNTYADFNLAGVFRQNADPSSDEAMAVILTSQNNDLGKFQPQPPAGFLQSVWKDSSFTPDAGANRNISQPYAIKKQMSAELQTILSIAKKDGPDWVKPIVKEKVYDIL